MPTEVNSNRMYRFFWSGRWESNPRPKLGKLLYCHCTTPALKIKLADCGGRLQWVDYRSLHSVKPAMYASALREYEFRQGGTDEKKTPDYSGRCNSGAGTCSSIARGSPSFGGRRVEGHDPRVGRSH